MSYTTRKDLFEKIETHRSRPLIAYVTSIRPNFSGKWLVTLWTIL